MAQRLCFLIFNVITVTGVSSLGQRLAPWDVNLNWINDFEPQLSWKPPAYLPEGCCFCVMVNSTQSIQSSLHPNDTNYREECFTNNGSLNMSVQTICDDATSEPVKKVNIYPELVTELDCYILTHTLIRCTWSPVPGAPESTFFYKARYSNRTYSNLQPCPKVYNDGRWTVCDLQIRHSHLLAIVFHANVDNKVVRNTFKKDLEIKPSFKNWTVKQADDKFNMSWSIPDDADASRWEFAVLYDECAESKSSDVIVDYSHMIPRLSNCRYCFAIQASFGDRNTRTEKRCFDAHSNNFQLAAFIVPLTCIALAVLALLYCTRNKDSIFPPIPKPRDLLSDISDNNNKTQFEKIHFPSEEEELFKITLVTDPPIDKPGP